MYDQKPTTSLMEDLQVLGLVSGGNKRKLSENSGGMEPEDGPDNSMAAPDPNAAPPPPPAHGHDGGEPDGDEAGAAPAPKSPPMPSKGFPIKNAPAPKDSYDAMAPGMGGAGAAPAPAPAPQSAFDAMGPGEAPADDEMAAYESAWDCIKQYYALNERNEKLSEDDYKTVVNAMSFVIETQAKYMESELDKSPNELPGGTDPGWSGDAKNNPQEKVQGTGAMRKIKGWKYHDASPRAGEKAESLDSLVGELRSLTQKTESDDEMQELGSKIIEGFEAIRDTAAEAAQSIASELKESNERVTENHPRVRLGKYFEGVSSDAKLLLKAISEREQTDVDDAIEDLNSLARDLKRGLAQLQ